MSKPVRILLIEDDESDAVLLRELLRDSEPHGFTMDRADRLAEGLARLDDGRYDIALVDVSLPDASGLESVQRVRERAPELPVLVLTGHDDPRLAAGAGRAGASDYIVKGQFSPTALARAIRLAIEREHLESAMRRRVAEIESLKKDEQLRREFLANVSHELRTPIAAIKGAAETLKEGGLTDKRNRAAFVGMIENHADRLLELVEELLLIAELEGPRRTGSRAAVASILRSELEKLQPEIERRKLGVELRVADRLQAAADPKHVGEAARNLLRNAVEYNRDGGRVEVSAAPEGGEIVLCVRDTGVGVPAADLGLIFERFHRAPEARARRPLGTGLGLFVVKRVARAYGGRVWAESVEGAGSSFYLALPAA